MKLHQLTALEIAQKIKSRQLSAEEVLDAHLRHIAAVDGVPGTLDGDSAAEPDKVHAFITLTAERARAQAQAVDEKIAAGQDPGPLAGVPITIKDIFCVEDTPSTAASKILANFNAPYTATAVQRMEAAGAVVLGKVNLDEFTYGSST
jgi:aspartyl-tRNA(Asn)/glutamyl-tRNA(Gln) amidotransferase subunit A